MISAFQCDFSLIRDGEKSIKELDYMIQNKDTDIMKDIELLEELEYMLRHGKAEIHIK